MKKLLLAFGSIFGLWAGAAMVSAIMHAGGIGELARQYMIATGMIQEHSTLVDFYTHIKGIEYLICVAFFVAFPTFFKYVNSEKKPATLRLKH